MFDNIPTVLKSEEIVDKMFRRAKKVEVAYLRNRLAMEKNLSISKIYTARDVAVSTLRKYVSAFPYINMIHPFYRALLDLLLDKNQYKKSLSSVNWAAGRIDEFASRYASKIKGVGSVGDALKIRKQFYGRAASLLKNINKELNYLNHARDVMRKLPHVDVELATVVIAGAPNVGKSELMASISSAKPEIATYPFTTKGIILGHLEYNGRIIQIIDTPGLLDRPLEKRNKIERQAILALKYLAKIIVFMMDPSETCGYRMEEQLKLLGEIKKDFHIPMLEVENKVDLVKKDSSRLKISAKTGAGVRDVVETILSMLNSPSYKS